MIHCAPVISVPISRWSTGSATLMTVPSMKVMLDAKMVAASTHGAACLEQRIPAIPARIAASSQGALINLTSLDSSLHSTIND
jgi:hypothetical protein